MDHDLVTGGVDAVAAGAFLLSAIWERRSERPKPGGFQFYAACALGFGVGAVSRIEPERLQSKTGIPFLVLQVAALVLLCYSIAMRIRAGK